MGTAFHRSGGANLERAVVRRAGLLACQLLNQGFEFFDGLALGRELAAQLIHLLLGGALGSRTRGRRGSVTRRFRALCGGERSERQGNGHQHENFIERAHWFFLP